MASYFKEATLEAAVFPPPSIWKISAHILDLVDPRPPRGSLRLPEEAGQLQLVGVGSLLSAWLPRRPFNLEEAEEASPPLGRGGFFYFFAPPFGHIGGWRLRGFEKKSLEELDKFSSDCEKKLEVASAPESVSPRNKTELT